jgi:hypothetical protein
LACVQPCPVVNTCAEPLFNTPTCSVLFSLERQGSTPGNSATLL